MEIFRQLETINKPAFHMAYRIEDPVKDTRSNLKIRQYFATAAPIPLLKFYYQDEFAHLKRIEAEIMQSNALYTNRRTLVLEFEEEESRPLLIRYSIQGFQKMILSDSVPFSVTGQIDW